MVVLGLGSNVGDRLANLRLAYQAINKLADLRITLISPVYLSDALLPENAPPEWDMPHLNFALRCETTLAPLELLKALKTIEWSIGRKPAIRHWGPRILDIDILAWDDLVMESDALTVPHHHLQVRPFALWPLADVAPFWQFPLPGDNHGKTAAQIVEKWGSRFTSKAPFRTRQIQQRIDMPQLVGILNVTPDSFSAASRFSEVESALAHVRHLVAAGAEVIDIGAESTSPDAQAINEITEWERLEPILMAIKSIQNELEIPPKISIDTRHATVAEKALACGIDWVNDVTGLDDPAMRALVRDSGSECVIMHHLLIPECRKQSLPRHQDPTAHVYDWGCKRLDELEQYGIARNKMIFDPGIGFGVQAEQSLALINGIKKFESLGTRLLVGHSRKTFLSLFTNQPFDERDIETQAISLALAKTRVDYLRLHQVEICARGYRVFGALQTLVE